MADSAETPQPHILVEPLGDAVKVILNRPAELNAITLEMVADLTATLGRVVQEGARAVLLTGAGRAFCSGASLKPGAAGPISYDEQFDRYYNPLARTLSELPVPIVTALNGAAAGAGASIALAGDLVVAGRSSYLMLSFARIGLAPDIGATWLVARSAGRARALEMALLGDKMPAEEAHRAGLVTRVVDDADVLPTAEQLCARLAAMPTRTLGLIRSQVRAALESGFDASLERERDTQKLCGQTADFREGLAAFREKRPPVFTGR
jgi:2-(1,2-epoxy-1,2-dihydrophenyl)acetyl-CoA isomerase